MQGYKIEHGLCIKACGGSGVPLSGDRPTDGCSEALILSILGFPHHE
jgi:hypothetical protein